MADSDDDMPPLEYVGNVPATTNSFPEDDDDDMPPLEYVGADASLGISLREGDRVTLKGLSKTTLNGQTGTLQSFQKASKGRLPVKLDKSGSMLAVKPENIEKNNEKNGNSIGMLNQGVATAKATQADRNSSAAAPDDEDDELPPLEYIGTISAASTKTEQQDRLNKQVKITDDADDMPSLEYFGTSKPSQSRESKEWKQTPPYAEARATGGGGGVGGGGNLSGESGDPTPGTFRPGDQVLVKGTGKPQLDGQQGIIENIKDGNCQVKVESSGKSLQLAQGNLHKIWLRGNGAGAMPPLQVVGQANGCASPVYSAVPNGQTTNAETTKTTPSDRTSGTRLQSPGNPQEVQEALQLMRSALHATTLAEVEAALKKGERPGMAWGEWETEKIQIVKQLKAKRTDIVNSPQPAEVPNTHTRKSTIEKWCQDLQLPPELLARLHDEDVTDPEELTGVDEKELAALTSGLKIGPKGRFMKAVKRMKSVEAAELGSTVSLS